MKRVYHKGYWNKFLKKMHIDRNVACIESAFDIKNPLIKRSWKDVTCKHCLQMSAAKKYWLKKAQNSFEQDMGL
jgi:hypothetical protein